MRDLWKDRRPGEAVGKNFSDSRNRWGGYENYWNRGCTGLRSRRPLTDRERQSGELSGNRKVRDKLLRKARR